MQDDEVSSFAKTFSRFAEEVHRVASQQSVAPIRDLLAAHLAADPAILPVVAESHAPYDHVNLQVAIEAFLDADGRPHELIGLTGQQRRWMSLADLISANEHSGVMIGSVDYANLPTGPDDTKACVAFGLYLIDDRGTKLAALVRLGGEETGTPGVGVEIVCADRERARAMHDEIRRLMVERNVFRRQMISFGEPRMGRVAAGPIVFHRRPLVEQDAIVLPPGVLDRIERHVFGIAEQRERLRAGGQHIKRGLLLHGPPGTGKTLTARYVAGRATSHTVVLLTGGGLGMVRAACALARMLQPSIVILEDVDLVAQHRMYSDYGNPLLFDVLNEMDGMDEDADVAFLLTTNRADLLEPALAARPGRIDLAVEVPLPDDDARHRLFELYARGIDVHVDDVVSIVEATRGVTASFMKELVRAASLTAALRAADGRILVEDADVRDALEGLLDESNRLTRLLLGAAGQEAAGVAWLDTDGE
ncbi:MAG TPA: AAA family ATPase [Actinomycetota bacterium]|nr:AAA family ATPase [Actinomycetota bacterium]